MKAFFCFLTDTKCVARHEATNENDSQLLYKGIYMSRMITWQERLELYYLRKAFEQARKIKEVA